MKTVLMIIYSVFILSNQSHGDTYRYKDDKGTPCFTNDLKDIPAKYRKSAVLISTTREEEEASLPQADKIDESLLPQKEEVTASVSVAEKDAKPASRKEVFRNIIIISSLFLATLIPSIFVSNRIFSRLLISVSLLSMLTLLGYVTTVFFSRSMHILKKDASQMKETIKKKEEEKGKEIQNILGPEPAPSTE